MRECNCASGTAHNDGHLILEAIRQQHRGGPTEDWEERAEDLEAEVTSLGAALASSEDEISQVCAARDEKSSKVCELEDELSDREEKLAYLEAEVAALKAFL